MISYFRLDSHHFQFHLERTDRKEPLKKMKFVQGPRELQKSGGGPKAQLCPTFQKIQVLLHFYVTIFLDSQSQGGPRPPWTPWIRGP